MKLLRGQDILSRYIIPIKDTTILTPEGTILKGQISSNKKVGIWNELNKSNVVLKTIRFTDTNIAIVKTYHYNTITNREEYSCVIDTVGICKNKVGLYKSFYKSGKPLQIGNFNSNGKGEGIWIYYYENGNISQKFQVINGSYEGIYESYYENSKIKSKGRYSNNNKIGVWKEYDEYNKLTKRKYP